jgi:hypothetical protein
MEEYSLIEKNELVSEIETRFGKVEMQLLDKHPGDIRVDIGVIPPKAGRNYYTLVTMGAGAHEMNTPEELEEYMLQRAEFVMCLPYYWQLGNADPFWKWPIDLMRQIALHVLNEDEWLGWGYYVRDHGPFVDGILLEGAILYDAECLSEYDEEAPEEGMAEAWSEDDEEEPEDQSMCILDGGKVINFYQIMPLVGKELDFLADHEPEELLSEMGEVSFVVNPVRRSEI